MRCLIVSLFIILNSFALSAKEVTPNDRVQHSLLVRVQPNSESAILGRLSPSESRPYSNSVPYYYEIDFTDNQKGYVHKGFASIVNWNPADGVLTLNFMDVGQGDATLIECPNGKNILVDAGSTGGGSAEDAKEYIENALSDRSNRIHSLVITHPDGDHYNYLEALLDNVPVERAFWTGVKYDFANARFRDWFFGEKFKNKRTNFSSAYFDQAGSPNPEIDCGEASVYVLAAGVEAKKSRKNALSIVLMIDYGDFEAVLTGDATFDTENKIIERYTASWLDVDLLKLGHHGSSTTSTGPTWADTLKPEYAVVSAGYDSSHGHPRKSVIEIVEPYTTNTAIPHTVSVSTGKRGNYDWSETKVLYKENIFSTVNSGNIAVKYDGSEVTVSVEVE